MRTVKNNGIKKRTLQEIDIEKICAACGNRKSDNKSCFYEFAAEKSAGFTEYIKDGRSKFISSMRFSSR